MSYGLTIQNQNPNFSSYIDQCPRGNREISGIKLRFIFTRPAAIYKDNLFCMYYYSTKLVNKFIYSCMLYFKHAAVEFWMVYYYHYCP